MTRPIRFRAWILDENHPEQVFDDYGNPTKYLMCYDLAFEDYQPINDLLQYVENLMQFTGLKDCKGVEIWEGDIIGQGEHRYVVEFKKGGFGCKFKFHGWQTLGYIYENIGEVLGNIYENPELLK